ncbi:flagellar biosynthesis anti-sigma factor FlgM [Deferribacteraceae bacterium V6Fe1]|nr:flagellar biosynthesis anti-sigma factor FlgM [Deferribacteraceae bacterium V6Fe1]
MRIEDKINIAYENLGKAVKKDSEQAKPSGKERTAKDKVELSSSGKVDSLVSKVKSAPEVRAEKVSEIKKQIETGTYDFSGRKVVEKIVNTAVDDLF